MIEFHDRSTPTGDDLNEKENHKKMFSGDLTRVGKIGGFFSLLSKEKNIGYTTNRGCRAQCTFSEIFNGKKCEKKDIDCVLRN